MDESESLEVENSENSSSKIWEILGTQKFSKYNCVHSVEGVRVVETYVIKRGAIRKIGNGETKSRQTPGSQTIQIIYQLLLINPIDQNLTVAD